MNIEHRLAALDQGNKSRKSARMVAGSLIKFVTQTSETFVVNAQSGASAKIRVRFIPRNTINGRAMVTLRAIVSSSSDFSTTWPLINSYNEVQTGDKSIIIPTEIFTFGNFMTFYVKIIATGSSDGNFSIIQ